MGTDPPPGRDESGTTGITLKLILIAGVCDEPGAPGVTEPDAADVTEPEASGVAGPEAAEVAEPEAAGVAEPGAVGVAESEALGVAEPPPDTAFDESEPAVTEGRLEVA